MISVVKPEVGGEIHSYRLRESENIIELYAAIEIIVRDGSAEAECPFISDKYGHIYQVITYVFYLKPDIFVYVLFPKISLCVSE
jgi:hypothetical protein